MGGINAAAATDKHVHRQIQIYESRLDKALVKYNEAAAYNTKLNRTIGNLRRERVVCDGIHKKLERELVEKTRKMAEIIEISNAAYEDRDKAQAEMVALKGDADKQQAIFDEQWTQLGQLIDQDRQTKELRKEQEENLSGKVDPVVEEEQRLRGQVWKGYENIKENKTNIHHSMEKVQSYEEAFAKIQKATAITDIDELVNTFTNAEDQNFSLFNYVNDLSNEIERLEESCANLKEDTKKYSPGGAEGSVRAKKMIVESMGITLNRMDGKSKTFAEQKAAAETSTNSLKAGIMQLFEKVGCQDEQTQTREALLNAGVTEGNMMEFLGVIEDRISSLLQVYQMEQSDETDAKEWEDQQFEEEDGNDGDGDDDGDDEGAGGGVETPAAAKTPEPSAGADIAGAGAAAAAAAAAEPASADGPPEGQSEPAPQQTDHANTEDTTGTGLGGAAAEPNAEVGAEGGGGGD